MFPVPDPAPTAPPARSTVPLSGRPLYVQSSFDELGQPLREVTFVVVDLETTGGSAADSSITEIGAVKVCGGEELGEFQTLVDPGRPIPPFITVLTGITESMVIAAPTLGAALPAFLEFAAGAVLVAHNAPFDVGFLKAGCLAQGVPWPKPAVVDTAVLARRVLNRDEVPNCRLGTLAPFFHARVTPVHRALADAQATVDVLHGLLERLGPLGVQSLDELLALGRDVAPERRRKRHLAQDLPSLPGVYVFRDGGGQPLYVGVSKDIRARVRSYFSAGETRRRMTEMVSLAERVEPIVCAHELEAQVRELRLIADAKPRYNRRSRFPERASWLVLTDEAFPRLSLVSRARGDGRTYLGPFGSRRSATAAMDAVHEVLPLRRCTPRLGLRPRGTACALAGIGRCGAPCEGGQSVSSYGEVVAQLRQAIGGDVRPLLGALLRRIERLAGTHRYEAAATLRDRAATFVRACARWQGIGTLTSVEELVAARSDGDGGWDLVLVRRGRMVAADRARRGHHPVPLVEAMRATAETLPDDPSPLGSAGAEEIECLARWLGRPGTRLVHVDGVLASPAGGGAGLLGWLKQVEGARRGLDPLGDEVPGTVARPDRPGWLASRDRRPREPP